MFTEVSVQNELSMVCIVLGSLIDGSLFTIGFMNYYESHSKNLFSSFFPAKEMNNITSNFRLGFGAFVDKPLAPYIETQPDR